MSHQTKDLWPYQKRPVTPFHLWPRKRRLRRCQRKTLFVICKMFIRQRSGWKLILCSHIGLLKRYIIIHPAGFQQQTWRNCGKCLCLNFEYIYCRIICLKEILVLLCICTNYSNQVHWRSADMHHLTFWRQNYFFLF